MPLPAEHGTLRRYRRGCKCAPCLDAIRAYLLVHRGRRDDEPRVRLTMPLHLAREVLAAAPKEARDHAIVWARSHRAFPLDSELLRAACRVQERETAGDDDDPLTARLVSLPMAAAR